MDDIISQYQIIALGSYFFDKYITTNIIEVVSSQQFSLSKEEGKWKKTDYLGRKRVEEVVFEPWNIRNILLMLCQTWRLFRTKESWKSSFRAVEILGIYFWCCAKPDSHNKHYNIDSSRKQNHGGKIEVCKRRVYWIDLLSCYPWDKRAPSFCLHQQLLNDGLEHTAEICDYHLDGYFIVSTYQLHDSEGKLLGGI